MPRLTLPRLPGPLRNVSIPSSLPRRLLLALRRDLTVANLTERLASVHKDRVAFELETKSVLAGTKTLTFEDVDRVVGRLATELAKQGMPLGELAAVVPSNGVDFLLTLLAVIRAGGVAVPVNPILKPEEVRTLVSLADATTLIGDARTYKGSVGPRTRMPSIERWFSLGKVTGAVDLVPRMRRVKQAVPPMPAASDTVVSVMYTSGTTGRPKGARLTNDGLLSMLSPAALQPTGLPLTVRTAVTGLPIAHIMGLSSAVGLMLAGITNRMFGHFDAAKVLDVIEKEQADMFVGVPAMYRAMLDAGAEDRDLTSVKVWASAADVMPRDLAKRFQKMGRIAGPVPALFMEAYGMVELAGAAMAKVMPPGPVQMPKRFAGMPVFPYRVKVVDKKGKELPRGQVGELCVRGPGVLEGYHRDPEATGKVLEGGWLRTGDLARIGPLGTVFFEGRQKDVIKVGGYSVFPVEVEEEIRQHPKVADAAVLAIEDETKGSVVGAAVVAKKGAALKPADLERWAKKELAAYRRPKRWL
ncbi:MAG: class I adenylate-forming enzyme family protein, partial [Actinomycetota bacterium]